MQQTNLLNSLLSLGANPAASGKPAAASVAARQPAEDAHSFQMTMAQQRSKIAAEDLPARASKSAAAPRVENPSDRPVSASALAKSDPGFGPMAKDFVGMQVQGIKANPAIPVHPGLAKFLKEQKAWDDKWKVASGA